MLSKVWRTVEYGRCISYICNRNLMIFVYNDIHIIYIYIYTHLYGGFFHIIGVYHGIGLKKYRTGPLFLVDFSESNPSNEPGRQSSLRLALGL